MPKVCPRRTEGSRVGVTIAGYTGALMSDVPSKPGLTRRAFVNLVGSAGGLPAAYSTMLAMGLLPVPAAYAGPPVLAPASGRGRRVVILGAGIARMTAAHELTKAALDSAPLDAPPR